MVSYLERARKADAEGVAGSHEVEQKDPTLEQHGENSGRLLLSLS